MRVAGAVVGDQDSPEIHARVSVVLNVKVNLDVCARQIHRAFGEPSQVRPIGDHLGGSHSVTQSPLGILNVCHLR